MVALIFDTCHTIYCVLEGFQCLIKPASHFKVPRAGAAGGNQMRKIFDEELKAIEEAGTYKHERIITSKQAPSIYVKGKENSILNFCANNYLGLSVSGKQS